MVFNEFIILGGLCSFSLILLILSFVRIYKSKPKNGNLGGLLIEFLNFYGNIFDFSRFAIDATNKKRYNYIKLCYLISPLIFYNEGLESEMLILDPISKLNVAKNTFRIEEIRQLFSCIHNKIKCFKFRNEYDSNIIYVILFQLNQLI